MGQLGDGTRIDKYKPVKVLSDVSLVDTGSNFTIALKKDNTVWTWGINNSGQLGTGDTKSRLKPTKVLDLTKASSNGSCTIPTMFMDGSLDDWNNPEPVIQDALSDVESGKADLENVYGFMDKKNIYLPAKVKGEETEMHVEFDNNGDGKAEYNANIGSDRNIVFTGKYDDKGNWKQATELLTCNYEQSTFEMTIPLSVIGNPKQTSIWICVNTMKDDGKKDDSGDWTVVPIK